MKILKIQKIFHFFQISDFFKIFFDFEKKCFFSETKLLKSKICPGIQKSYLENHTSILKLFKPEFQKSAKLSAKSSSIFNFAGNFALFRSTQNHRKSIEKPKMGFRSGNMLKTIPITRSVPSMKPNGPVHPDVARCDGLELTPYKLQWDFPIPECLPEKGS